MLIDSVDCKVALWWNVLAAVKACYKAIFSNKVTGNTCEQSVERGIQVEALLD